MVRFLVTGGAGFIGSHIAEELVRRGTGEVLAFDNLSTGHVENIRHLGDAVKLIEGDVRNHDQLCRAMEGVDCVFHEAAFVSAFDSYNQPAITNEVNILGTFNVLAAARDTGVRRVVLASSAAVYGNDAALPCSEGAVLNPQSPYAISKVTGEHYARLFARHFGLETVCLRYFNVFGPRQDPSSEYSGVISRFASAISARETPVIYGDGRQTRDFISAREVARVNVLAATGAACGRGEVINIGSGIETNLLDVIDAIGKVLGHKVEPRLAPQRENDIRRSVADVTLAEKLLGFRCEVSFEKGMRELIHSAGNLQHA